MFCKASRVPHSGNVRPYTIPDTGRRNASKRRWAIKSKRVFGCPSAIRRWVLKSRATSGLHKVPVSRPGILTRWSLLELTTRACPAPAPLGFLDARISQSGRKARLSSSAGSPHLLILDVKMGLKGRKSGLCGAEENVRYESFRPSMRGLQFCIDGQEDPIYPLNFTWF